MRRNLARHESTDDGDCRRILRRARSAARGGIQLSARLRHAQCGMHFQDVQERRLDDPGVRLSSCADRRSGGGGGRGGLRALFRQPARAARAEFLRLVPSRARGRTRASLLWMTRRSIPRLWCRNITVAASASEWSGSTVVDAASLARTKVRPYLSLALGCVTNVAAPSIPSS